MSGFILYLNASLWIITFIYWAKKKELFNVGIVILLLYTLISCASCHLFSHPDMIGFYEDYVYVLPFIYLYFVILLLLHPILHINYNKIKELKLPSKKIIEPICVFIIISAVYQLVTGLPDIKQGMTLMLLDSSNAIDAYIDTTEANMERKALTGSFNILGFLITTGMSFSMLFFFLYILYPNKNNKILIGLIVAVMANPIMSVASGSREKVVITLLVFCFMFLLLRPFISRKIRRVISVVSVSFFVLLLLFFVIISFARARGDIDKVLLGFESYFGMSFLHFNQKCFYANGTREGNLVSPLFNVILGGQTYSQEALRDKYASLGVDNGIFYTFVGDFVLDYGPFIAFVILVAFAYFCRRIYKVCSIWSGGHVVLCYILLKLLSGFYLHQYSGVGGNLLLIELLIFYVLFSYKKNKKLIPFVTIKVKENE